MNIINFPVFITVTLVLIVTPGPDLIYVLTKGISLGRKAGILSAVGVSLGILVHTIFAAFGLSVILKTSAMAFSIVKIIGAGYLIYLGIKTLRSDELFINEMPENQNKRRIFTQGIISNVLNPKVALFFMAFLPQFIKTEAQYGFSALPFLFLGSIVAISTLVLLVILGYFSGTVGQYLCKNKSGSKWIKRISGSVLLILGMRLVFIRQK